MYGRTERSGYKPEKIGEKIKVWSSDGLNPCLAKTILNDSGILCVRFLENAQTAPNKLGDPRAGIKGMVVPIVVLLAFADIEKC